VEDIDKLLEQTSYQIKIDLKEAPEDRQVLVGDLFGFAAKRKAEKVEIPCEHVINNMIEEYEELKGKLEKINNKEDRETLEKMLNLLIEHGKESAHSVIGWHDIFFFYSFHSIELAHDYLDADDLIYIQHSFGGYCHYVKKYTLAEAYYRRALDTLFEAAEGDLPSARAMMCTPNLLFDLGSLMYELNRDKEAEEFYNIMLKGKDLFIELDPDYYKPLIADAYYDLALVYLNTNRLKKAKESAVEAYVIYKRLHKTDPERWKESVESASDLLDDIEARLGR
jgi:tetratricopeptide (TPR) repeat protein